MSYKILKQTDKAFQIKHPDGSTFTVPKKGLSKSMMDKIAKMPGFADGGPISVSDPMTQQDREVGQRLRENELEYQKRLARPSESAISPGYLPEAPVTESEISPIDLITPGMVAAPVKAAAKGVGMLGRGAMAVGREAVEAAPRILGNEIGAVGRDVKAAVTPLVEEVATQSKPAYQGVHEAPGPENVAIHDLVKGGAYPEDVYSVQGAQYYGHGEPKMDAESIQVLRSVKDKPNATITIYRAVPKTTTNAEKAEMLDAQMKEYLRRGKMPKDSKFDNGSKWFDWAYDERARLRALPETPSQEITTINPGDWVTASRTYAKQHGESTLYGEYKILSKKVKAKELFTDSNSIHEYGYHPEAKNIAPKSNRETLPMDKASRMARAKEIGAINKEVKPNALDELIKDIMKKKQDRETLIESFNPETMAFESRGQSGHKYLVSPDPKNEGKWRYTVFDERGPLSHYENLNFKDSLKEAYASGADLDKKLPSDSFAHGGIVGKDKDMSYRIIKDAEDHYQVMHPDGSKFTVPKKGISKQMHEKISGMPKLYNGGLMSDAEMEEASMLPAPTFTTPVDAEIDSIQNQLSSGSTLSSDVAVPLANRLAQLKTVQGSIIDAKRNPVSGGLPEHYRFDKSAAGMPSQEMQPSRAPAVEEDESVMMEEPPMAPQVAQPVAQAAPQNQYDAMFQTMGGRLAAPAKALATAENDYRMRTLLAQNEAEVRQQEMNDYIGQADKEAADFAEANRVDPNRYWSSMNTGNKIQAALAIALGGIGAGLAGGENQALKIINKAIDADIDAQKENRNSLYNVMLSKHKRHEMALSAAKGDALQKVQNALNTFTVQAKSAEAQQGAAKLANDLELQKLAYKDYFQKKNAGDYLSYQAQNGATLTPNEIEVLPKEKRERLVNGAGFASNMESAKKIREAKADVMGIENDIGRLLQIRRQYGSEVFPTEVAKEARALAMGIQAKLRVPILGPGTVNDSERQMLQDLMNTDPTRFFSTDAIVQTQLQTVMGMAQRNFDNMLKAEGIGVKPRPTRMENAPGMQQGLMLNK